MLHPTKGVQHTKNRHLSQISCHGRNCSQSYFFKRNQSGDNRSHGFGAKFLLKKLSASDFSYERKSASRQRLGDSQKFYVSILRQNSAPPQPQDKASRFSGEKLIIFVANVAIQVAQPKVCYAYANQDAIDKKSSLCRRVSEAAKNHLGVNITGISLFDAKGQLRPSLLPKVKPHSNSHHPPKSPNYQPYLNLSAPKLN